MTSSGMSFDRSRKGGTPMETAVRRPGLDQLDQGVIHQSLACDGKRDFKTTVVRRRLARPPPLGARQICEMSSGGLRTDPG